MDKSSRKRGVEIKTGPLIIFADILISLQVVGRCGFKKDLSRMYFCEDC